MSKLAELTEQQKDRARRNARKMQTSAQPYMRYHDCAFRINGNDVNNSEWIAAADSCEAVWNLFIDGTVDEISRVNMLEGEIPKRPEAAYPSDKSQWPLRDGKPSDPLGLQFEMPLISVGDGRVVVFKASTILTKAAIGRVLEDFLDHQRRPFVTLMVTPSPDNINVMEPNFLITGYSDHDVDLPTNTSAAVPKLSAPVKPMAPADIDDDIPFSPEFR